MIAIGAIAVTTMRVLIPVAGMVGRYVWHWLDKATGALTKDGGAPEVIVPEPTAEAEQQQQRQQPQQQQVLEIPNNRKVKTAVAKRLLYTVSHQKSVASYY